MTITLRETTSCGRRLPFSVRPAAILLILLGLVLHGCSRESNAPQEWVASVSTQDGFNIATTSYIPQAHAPPGLILVHRYGGNRALWKHVAALLQQQGVHSIALDLRGHGKSFMQNEQRLNYRQLPDNQWLDALADIRAVKTLLLEKGADPERIAIAGEGLGATLALYYALEDPDIQGVVMISPGLELNNITTANAIQQLDDCPTLLMSSEGDAYAATSATALNQSAPVFSELRTWSGSAHGVDLFVSHPEAAAFMIDWLDTVLSAASQ